MKELIDLLKIGQKGIIVLSIAIVLDMVTGVIKAIMNHDLQSSEFRKGLLKKLLDIVLVVVAYSLDWLLTFNYIGISVLYFLIAMEFYSVLENVREYLPLPKLLIKILDMLQKKGEANLCLMKYLK